MESSVVLFKPRIHLFACTHPSVSISLVCNDWLAYKHQSTALSQTRLECGSLSAYMHQFPALCFNHVLRRGVQTLGAVTASLMILLRPRPSSCVPGTGTQSFNRCFPTKHHTEDGPSFSSSVAWRVSSSSSRTGSLMSLLSVHTHLSPALFKHV